MARLVDVPPSAQAGHPQRERQPRKRDRDDRNGEERSESVCIHHVPGANGTPRRRLGRSLALPGCQADNGNSKVLRFKAAAHALHRVDGTTMNRLHAPHQHVMSPVDHGVHDGAS
jgi:hypothetical protein